MEYFGNLKKKLSKLALRHIIRSLVYVALLFIATMLITENLFSYYYSTVNLNTVNTLFVDIYDTNIDFLKSKSTTDLILADDNFYQFSNALNRFNSNMLVKSNVIILDDTLNLMYSSYNDQRETDIRLSYTRAIANKLPISSKDIQNSVHKNSKGFSDLMLTTKVIKDNATVGYITSFLSGYEWSYYLLSNYNHDSIITDMQNNIIFYNKPSLLQNNFILNNESFRVKIKDKSYRMVSQIDSERNIKLFSLTESNNMSSIFMTILISFVVGYIWYKQSNKTANILIDNNINSVNHLIKEIESISNSDLTQRVTISTHDEYEYVGDHINEMLDRIDSLNKRNTDLLKLNSTIEMKQLLSQYNPHFLYNTLEVIRSHYAFDKDTANLLILKLTSILRYSINNPVDDVILKDDMKYLEDYLYIQKTRFGNRFNYEIEITDEANECTIPKLVLQPVIENSIKYGFESQFIINISIKAEVVNNVLILEVIDDGPGMSEKEITDLNEILRSDEYDGTSIGLYNTSRRIYLTNPQENKIQVSNSDKKGLEVLIMIAQHTI